MRRNKLRALPFGSRYEATVSQQRRIPFPTVLKMTIHEIQPANLQVVHVPNHHPQSICEPTPAGPSTSAVIAGP